MKLKQEERILSLNRTPRKVSNGSEGESTATSESHGTSREGQGNGKEWMLKLKEVDLRHLDDL